MRNITAALALVAASCGATPPTTAPSADPPTFVRIDAPAEATSLATRFEARGSVAVAKELAYPDDVPGAVDGDSRPRGRCSVFVRFVDADTGAPVATTATLWRLGVDADGGWSAGDQVERVVECPAETAAVCGLPAGRYRFECDAQRTRAPDPPEFVVEPPIAYDLIEQGFEFRVQPPRKFRAKLVVFDETGRRVERGRLGVKPCSHYSDAGAIPAWATPRRALDGRKPPDSGHVIGCGVGPSDSDLKDATATNGAFDLGEFTEDLRGSARDEACRFEAANGGRTGFLVPTRDAADVTFVAIVVPEEIVIARVVRPDGTPLRRSEFAYVWTHGGARPANGPIGPDDWRNIPVSANVQVQDLGWLEFKWTAATADEPHAFAPTPPKSSK